MTVHLPVRFLQCRASSNTGLQNTPKYNWVTDKIQSLWWWYPVQVCLRRSFTCNDTLTRVTQECDWWTSTLHHFAQSFLKCPYYGLWKVHILVLGVPNNRLTCMQGQKTLSFISNTFLIICTIHLTINYSKPLLCLTLICGDWSISFKAVFVSF